MEKVRRSIGCTWQVLRDVNFSAASKRISSKLLVTGIRLHILAKTSLQSKSRWQKEPTGMRKVSLPTGRYTPATDLGILRSHGVLDLERGDRCANLRGHAPQGKPPSRHLCLWLRVALSSPVTSHCPDLQGKGHHCAGAIRHGQNCHLLDQHSANHRDFSPRNTRYGDSGLENLV